MIFKQLFDNKSSTYTYIISSGKGREALIIDPVIENTPEYLKVLKPELLVLTSIPFTFYMQEIWGPYTDKDIPTYRHKTIRVDLCHTQRMELIHYSYHNPNLMDASFTQSKKHIK